MPEHGWRRGPYGLDGSAGATLGGRRTVLVVAHHLAAATRLADVVELVERDRRIQVVYTEAPTSLLAVGVGDFLHAANGITIPWHQAVNNEWDLAIAAGLGGLEQIHGPVLWMSHGIGPDVRAHRWAGSGRPVTRPIIDMRREAFVSGGRVIPAVLALAHEYHRAMLTELCPEAAESITVVGDLAFDRLVASRPLRSAYRRRLGVGDSQELVILSSTWGPRSLVGQHADLLVQLAAELPKDRYSIAAILHPNIWCWHSSRQVRAWFDDCLRLGVKLIPPEEGWRAALVAADKVIGDFGSVTFTAAASGVPVLLAAFPDEDVVSGSPLELLGRIAPRLDLAASLERQVNDAGAFYSPERYEALHERITSRPGQAARLMRQEMYRLLGLTEPDAAPRVDPVRLPEPIRADAIGVGR
jgi:hypothetical protein